MICWCGFEKKFFLIFKLEELKCAREREGVLRILLTNFGSLNCYQNYSGGGGYCGYLYKMEREKKVGSWWRGYWAERESAASWRMRNAKMTNLKLSSKQSKGWRWRLPGGLWPMSVGRSKRTASVNRHYRLSRARHSSDQINVSSFSSPTDRSSKWRACWSASPGCQASDRAFSSSLSLSPPIPGSLAQSA